MADRWLRGPERARRDAKIVASYVTGKTMQVVAEEFGLCRVRVMGILRERGVTIRPRPKDAAGLIASARRRRKSRRNEEILAAHRRGMRSTDLARRYHVSPQRISQIIAATRPGSEEKE